LGTIRVWSSRYAVAFISSGEKYFLAANSGERFSAHAFDDDGKQKNPLLL